ncbi:hypothetical protein GYMLUDRAFT_76766 [Collybiopsis luxurians FD-317 M1]|uniref:Uncharacterized protein n=1 Tax=Collybiopsis luxurians FD-317 M1 TaxID=944289 RepID=A0A0D0CAJ6_9AGAR|nr:hypothetical protein GYMLUDRAFT_76766 [Collybiopsis luxurians FD-317 M1]
MPLKRESDSPTPSPRSSKRRKQNLDMLPPSMSDPVTPARTPNSILKFPSSASSFSSTSSYPPYPFDSPSNPFGRRRTLSASLPPKSAFGYHLPLRFQFLRHGTKRDKEGIYRIVQVPLTYTFQHLKALMAFLFGGQYTEPPEDEDEETGHLFEVRKGVAMYSKHYLLGTIKNSKTVVRLSSARDPYRYKQEWDNGGDWREEEYQGEEEDELARENEGSENEEEVRWEAEEDYTLGHVWKPALKGERPDDKTAIVYFHSSPSDPKHPIQIQITLHKDKVPSRQGFSNAPYVFEGRGHVYLSPLEPKDIAEGYSEEDIEMEIDTDTWNEPKNAFAEFLLYCVNIPPPDFQQSQRSSSSSSSASTFLPSSSPVRTIDDFSPFTPYSASSSPVRAPIAGLSSPLSFLKLHSSSYPKCTPAPPPAQRKRVKYLQKRIERSKLRKAPGPKDQEGDEDEEKKTSQSHVATTKAITRATRGQRKPVIAKPKPVTLGGITRAQAMAVIAADLSPET